MRMSRRCCCFAPLVGCILGAPCRATLGWPAVTRGLLHLLGTAHCTEPLRIWGGMHCKPLLHLVARCHFTFGNEFMRQQLLSVRALRRVPREASRYEVAKWPRMPICLGQPWLRLLEQLVEDRRKAAGVRERVPARGKLKEHHSEAPDVRGGGVAIVVALLRGQVDLSADASVADGVVHGLGDAKIADLHLPSAAQEDVTWFDVVVQEPPRVQMVEASQHLRGNARENAGRHAARAALEVCEAAKVHKLQHKVDVPSALGHEACVPLDKKGAALRLNEAAHLIQEATAVLALLHLQCLEGDRRPGGLDDALPHGPTGTGAQWAVLDPNVVRGQPVLPPVAANAIARRHAHP
mmetsp:Transcript_18684/g.38890  ORF Transcript_18684/g.38890 Transcript_18684/m.38890 type:complete len:351 (-) Transcript_18684:76-1128(-)